MRSFIYSSSKVLEANNNRCLSQVMMGPLKARLLTTWLTAVLSSIDTIQHGCVHQQELAS